MVRSLLFITNWWLYALIVCGRGFSKGRGSKLRYVCHVPHPTFSLFRVSDALHVMTSRRVKRYVYPPLLLDFSSSLIDFPSAHVLCIHNGNKRLGGIHIGPLPIHPVSHLTLAESEPSGVSLCQ